MKQITIEISWIPRRLRNAVVLEAGEWKAGGIHRWRNENPGEGGTSQSGRTLVGFELDGISVPAGTEILSVGGSGYVLRPVEGGFRSVPYNEDDLVAPDGSICVRINRDESSLPSMQGILTLRAVRQRI